MLYEAKRGQHIMKFGLPAKNTSNEYFGVKMSAENFLSRNFIAYQCEMSDWHVAKKRLNDVTCCL